MCGIAGYTTLEPGTTDPSVISRMLKKLQHRGPNDTGKWQETGITMGATRLSIMDLSLDGNQPFITQDKTGVLVYNGEVYNHNELRVELNTEFNNIPFRSTCDTETVLYALHQWGAEKAIQKLTGCLPSPTTINEPETYGLAGTVQALNPYILREWAMSLSLDQKLNQSWNIHL